MTSVLTIHKRKAQLKLAAPIVAAASKEGKICIIPTETSYGITTVAENKGVVEKICKIKGRPSTKAISVLVYSLNTVKKYCYITPEFKKLVKKFMLGLIS